MTATPKNLDYVEFRQEYATLVNGIAQIAFVKFSKAIGIYPFLADPLNFNRFIVEEFRLASVTDRRINVERNSNLDLIHIAGRYCLKVNKLKKNGCPVSDNDTKLSKDYAAQKALPGMDFISANLYLGYIHGSHILDLHGIYVTKPESQKSVIWEIKIDSLEDVRMPQELTMHTQEDSTEDMPIRIKADIAVLDDLDNIRIKKA